MGKKPSVEVVIPIYNEERELAGNIHKLHSFLEQSLFGYDWSITIADNASTDSSLRLAKSLAKKLPRLSVVHLDKKGRGRAVKTTWLASRADIVAYMDVDLSTDLAGFPVLLKALEKGYDLAIGSRLLPKSKVEGRTPKREILSRGYNILIKLFFQTNFSDAQCGFKAVNRHAVKALLPHIADDAWFFDSELLITAEKLGYKIYESPVIWIDNPGSTVRVLKTVTGDLRGLCRLFITQPWNKIRQKEV